MTATDGYPTQRVPADGASDYNAQRFMVMRLLADVRTAMPVRVTKCTNSGGLAAVGFVDVLPLVKQLDGDGKSVDHTTVHNLPYFRVQGGKNAVIMDPEPGDIGVAVFADRDISSVKVNRGPSNPGSWRKHDFSDGMYFGGILNAAPEQYIRHSADGIELVSPTQILMRAPLVAVEASTSFIVTSPLVNVDSPASTFTGAVTVQGLLTWMAGMVAGAGAAAGRVVTGVINLIGELRVNGVRVDDTHIHSTPNGNSSPPLP